LYCVSSSRGVLSCGSDVYVCTIFRPFVEFCLVDPMVIFVLFFVLSWILVLSCGSDGFVCTVFRPFMEFCLVDPMVIFLLCFVPSWRFVLWIRQLCCEQIRKWVMIAHGWIIVVWFLAGTEIFLFTLASRQALGPPILLSCPVGARYFTLRRRWGIGGGGGVYRKPPFYHNEICSSISPSVSWKAISKSLSQNNTHFKLVEKILYRHLRQIKFAWSAYFGALNSIDIWLLGYFTTLFQMWVLCDGKVNMSAEYKIICEDTVLYHHRSGVSEDNHEKRQSG
jgi:hypothetical protein